MSPIEAAKASLDLAEEFERRGVALTEARGASDPHHKAVCPFHADRGPSLAVYEDHYHCYGCGAHGDVLTLITTLDNIELSELLGQLETDGKIMPSERAKEVVAARRAEAERRRAESAPVISIPAPVDEKLVLGMGATAKTRPVLIKQGERTTEYRPTHTYAYRDWDGRLIGFVIRYPKLAEDRKTVIGKEFQPIVWAKWPNGAEGWSAVGFPKPRPFFGAHRFASLMSRWSQQAVLLVEGEKAAEVGQYMLLDDDGNELMPVLTWPNGAKSAIYADWAGLAKRVKAAGARVYYWPDADEPGMVAQQLVAAELAKHGVDLWAVPVPEGVSEGWDVADAFDEFWDQDRILDQILQAQPIVVEVEAKVDPDLYGAAMPAPQSTLTIDDAFAAPAVAANDDTRVDPAPSAAIEAVPTCDEPAAGEPVAEAACEQVELQEVRLDGPWFGVLEPLSKATFEPTLPRPRPNLDVLRNKTPAQIDAWLAEWQATAPKQVLHPDLCIQSEDYQLFASLAVPGLRGLSEDGKALVFDLAVGGRLEDLGNRIAVFGAVDPLQAATMMARLAVLKGWGKWLLLDAAEAGEIVPGLGQRDWEIGATAASDTAKVLQVLDRIMAVLAAEQGLDACLDIFREGKQLHDLLGKMDRHGLMVDIKVARNAAQRLRAILPDPSDAGDMRKRDQVLYPWLGREAPDYPTLVWGKQPLRLSWVLDAAAEELMSWFAGNSAGLRAIERMCCLSA